MSRLEGQVANKRRYEPDDLNGDEDTAKKAKTEDLEVSSVNTTGLLSLPVEVFEIIYTELLSTSRLISREEVLANNPHLDDSFQYRTDVLRSLTQTCRALRASCLPRYYEQVEACVCRGARVWYKQLAERLEKTSWMLIENPHLAMHVQYVYRRVHDSDNWLTHCFRTVTVSLTRCSTATVLPAFAACLTALPNLHTLRIMHAHSQMTTSLKNAFEHISLPQIRAIILPSCAHNILRSCPNIQDLTCNEEDGSKLISAMTKSSRNVEVIDGIYIYEALVKSRSNADCEYIVLTITILLHRACEGCTQAPERECPEQPPSEYSFLRRKHLLINDD